MKSIFVNFACLLSFFGISACATRVPQPASPGRAELSARIRAKPDLAVLFVGNSYSFGVPKAFSKCAAGQGRKVRVGHATYGGWTLRKHAGNAATLQKIRDGRWDIIAIQEQSEIPAMAAGKRAAAMFPPLRQLVQEARQQDAVPVLYQTWGRRDGDPKRRNDDFHAMTARLRAGYQAAAANAGGLVVIPVGDAWEREISAGRGGGLFMEDGSHPTPRGDELTAETFFAAFFRE